MTAWLIGAATLIIVALIAGRRSSGVLRSKTEEPKYQFLENLGMSQDALQQERTEQREPKDKKEEE